MGDERKLYGLEKVKDLIGKGEQPPSTAEPGSSQGITEIMNLVPGRGDLSIVPPSVQHSVDVLQAVQAMGEGFKRQYPYTPEEWIEKGIGYLPTFWEDPRRIARFHQGVQALPPDSPLPDWLDREKLGAAYKYLKYRNKSTPWYEWKFLNSEDPARQFLQGMTIPPVEMLMPEEMSLRLQQVEERGELEAAAVQAMAWPEKYSPEWEALPGWMKFAMTTVASGTWYGSALGGGLSIGFLGLLTGNVPGAIAGFGTGALLGAGTNLANQWLADFREKHPDAEWTSGISQALDTVLRAFDFGAEALERTIGTAAQVGFSLYDPERYGPVKELFESVPAAFETWRASTAFYSAFPGEVMPGGAELGEKWVLGKPEPVREVMDPTTGEMIQLPQPENYEEAILMFGDELTDCRRQLMEGTKSPRELEIEMAIKYGWSGQFMELWTHLLLDPGPAVMRALPERGLPALAKFTDDTALMMAAEAVRKLPKKQRGPFASLRAMAVELRTQIPMEQVTAGGLLTRYLGGVTAEGVPRLTELPRGPLGRLVGLTPRARAVEVLGVTGDTAKILMDQFDDPLELSTNWRKIAATPGQAAQDLSMRFIEAPDGMLTVMAMRDFDYSVLKTLETQWVSTELQRGILGQIARLKGISEFEVLKLLDDAEQAPALFKSIIEEATKVAEADPAAAELLKASQAGQFTEQTLRDLFKLYMTEGVAWHPKQWKAQFYDAWMTHVSDWTINRLGVSVAPMVYRLSSLMKSVQSIALLDVNPLYAINNGVNNISTMIIDGTFRLKTIKNALKWWDEFGLRPYRLRQAYGGVAGLSEFAGKTLVQLEAMAAESPEAMRIVSEVKASRAVADAAVGDGGLVRAQRWVGQLRRKVGFSSKVSRRIEEWSSVQATTAGAQQFWSRSWRAGVGYSRMPPGLEEALGPGIAKMVYGVVEGQLNADALESALLKQASIRGTVESFISDVAKDLGQDPADVAEIMQRSGATEFLDLHLQDAKTPDEVRGVFSMLDQHIQRQVDQLAVTEYISRTQHAAAQIKAGDYTGFLETWFFLNRTVDEWWTKHVMDWSQAVEEASKIDDGAQRNQIIAARMATANSEATRMQSFEMAAIEGMVDGLRDLGVDAPEGYVKLLQDQHQGNRDFFRLRDDLWREYFRTDFDSKESKRLRYGEIVKQLDNEYGRLAIETLHTQEQMDMAVVNMIARQDPDLADNFNVWLTDVRERRVVMIGREQNVRRANYDIITSEQATGKGFVTIIQAHFASDQEFLKAISPWLQQLRAKRGRLRYDDILVIRRRLYAEYLNHLKLPDIKDYFERRNQGLVDALSHDMTRPLPMPEAPEVPTPELPSRFERIQQDFETGRAQVTMSQSDIIDMVTRADEAIVKLSSDQTRPTAGGSRVPLWDQAGDLDVATAERLELSPRDYWWSMADAEVRDGILGLPEIKGSEAAAKGFLETVFNSRRGTGAPEIDVSQLDNDMIRTLAWEQGGIPTTSDSGAPLNAYLVNWINSVLGLRQAGTPIKSLDDLTDPQRLVVRLELYKRGQRRGVLEEESIRTRLTVESLEVMDDWGRGKPCGVRKMRRLGIHNGLNEGEVARMSADEIYDWLHSKRTGEPYGGPRFMTPEGLRDSFIELSGGDQEVAATTMALVEAAAIAKGMTLEDYVSQVFARSMPGEEPPPPTTLFQRAPRRPELAERAVNLFGVTEDPAEAAFILPDGQLLDFSGRSHGKKDMFGGTIEGGRLLEHGNILQIYRDTEIDYSTKFNARDRFITDTGSARMVFNATEGRPWLGLELSGPLTMDQVIAVHKILTDNPRGQLVIDCMDPQTSRVIKDLRLSGITREGINKILVDVEDVYSLRQPGKGAVTFIDDGRAILKALANPDASTCIHELGHVFRRQLPDTDMDVVVKWWQEQGKLKVSYEEGALLGSPKAVEKAEEMWARGFERYMAEGVAPIPALRSVFERFKRWIMSVYQKITGTAIDVELTNEVRKVMDEILAKDPETARDVEPGFDWTSGEARAPVSPVPSPEPVIRVATEKLPVVSGSEVMLGDRAIVIDSIGAEMPGMPGVRPVIGHDAETGQTVLFSSGDISRVVEPGVQIAPLSIEIRDVLERGGGIPKREQLSQWSESVRPHSPELADEMINILENRDAQPSTAEMKRWIETTRGFEVEEAPAWKVISAEDFEAAKRGVSKKVFNIQNEETGELLTSVDGTTWFHDDQAAANRVAAEMNKRAVPEMPVEPPGPRKGMDLHDWQVARNAELREAAELEDPQARIDSVNEIVEKYEEVKHHNWVTSEILAARIRAQAKAELRVIEGIPGLVGAGTSAHGPDPNIQYEFLYRVIELDDLVASHNRLGNVNPDYPDFLQPRDRARAVSQQQVKRIANDLNPDALLMPTTRIDDGTPIIGEDAVVESGNARVIALNEAALNVPERFTDYRNRMVEILAGNTAEYGTIDLDSVRSMEQPVLVRVRTSRDVDRVKFTRLANESATMGMSFVESAQADVNRLSVDSLAGLSVPEDWGLEQALRAPRNRSFVQGFVDQLPRNEVAMVVDPDGALSRNGMERLVAAMFAKTYYGEAGVRLVRTVFESQDINVRNIAKGMTASLGEMAKAEALIGAERRPLSLSIGEDLAAAVDKLQTLKERGMSVDQYMEQLVLFGRDLTPFQESLLVDLNNMARSPNAIRQVLDEYARLVQIQPDTDQLGLFGKVEYPEKVELWERAKQGPQQTFFQLPEQSEMGSVEGVPPELWMSQVTSDGWDQIRPVIDGMKEKMAGPDGWTREIGMDDVRTRLNAEQEREFGDWVRGVRGEMASTKMGAVRWGEASRDFSLLNYNARRGIDETMTTGLPYWLWPSRTFLNWIMRAVDRPALIANLHRIRHLQSHYQTVPGFPQRLKGKIRVPMPFLPEWMGGGLWVDPLRSMFPPAMFLGLADRVANVKNREVGKAEYIISNWVAEGKVSSSKGENALTTHEGDIWERALDQARLEEGEQFSGPLDYVSLLTSFAVPIEWARQYAKGTPENIGPLPITRFIKGVTAPLGIGGPGGINIEAPIRRAAGLPEYDRYEDYRIERMVSNMIADGVISAQEGGLAMQEHRGDAWDEAERRVNMARFYGTYANPLFWFGFPADSFPEGEAKQRALSRKWSAALEARNAGDDSALREFLEEYPEYKSRLDLFKDPEERLRYFLVDEIWTRYMALGSSNKEMVRLQLGEDFMYSFLSTETRSYEDIPIDVLAMWAKSMGAYIPETPDNRIEIPEETRGVELLDPTLSLAVDTFREIRNQKYPNWYAMQSGYYELPPGNQRRNYIVRFPKLQKYWEWRRKYLRDHPDVAAYSKRYDLETGEGESLGTLSVPEILTNRALMRQILGNRMTGEPLTSGALAELYRIWEGLDRPFDDIETWIENLDMTSQ